MWLPFCLLTLSLALCGGGRLCAQSVADSSRSDTTLVLPGIHTLSYAPLQHYYGYVPLAYELVFDSSHHGIQFLIGIPHGRHKGSFRSGFMLEMQYRISARMPRRDSSGRLRMTTYLAPFFQTVQETLKESRNAPTGNNDAFPFSSVIGFAPGLLAGLKIPLTQGGLTLEVGVGGSWRFVNIDEESSLRYRGDYTSAFRKGLLPRVLLQVGYRFAETP